MTDPNTKCILCGKISSLTEEHIIPDALAGQLIFKCLCQGCNSKLGEKIDSTLTNFFPVKAIRATYGIKGKTGKVPKIISGKGIDKTTGRNFLLFQDNGQLVAKMLPTPITEIEKGGSVVKHWSCDSSDNKTIKKRSAKIIKKYGQENVTVEKEKRTIQDLTLCLRLEFNLRFPFLAFLKIALEFLFLSFPDCEDWLNTIEMRNALLTCDETKARQFVLMGGTVHFPFAHSLRIKQGLQPDLPIKQSSTNLFCEIILFGEICSLVFLGDPGFKLYLEDKVYFQPLDLKPAFDSSFPAPD